MKIGDFPVVEAAIATRNHLVGQRDEGGYQLTINGCQQDHEMIERVRPAIRDELDRRILEIDSQLRTLGVRLD